MDEREQATEEIRVILEEVASRRRTIAYSEVVSKVRAMHLEPDSKLFAQILDDISRYSNGEGRGMLSAVVVHKGDDYLPGPGFFKLGQELSRDTSDQLAFHSTELRRVHDVFVR
jgi:hypothetical protein